MALSTALAKNESEYPIISTPSSTTEQAPLHHFPRARRHPAKVYILLVLGPSPSAAKARYLLEIDGFRVEQFGEWEYSRYNRDHQCSDGNEDEDNCDESSEFISPTRTPIRPTTPQKPCSEDLDECDSPCSPSSRASYPASVPSSPSETSLSDDGQSESSIGLSEEPNSFTLNQRAEEASLHTGERLLYRALFAGDEGLGFGDEICECCWRQ